MSSVYPERKDHNQAVVVLILLIVAFLLSIVCNILNVFGWGVPFAVCALIPHGPVFLRKKPPHLVVTVLVSILQFFLLLIAAILNFAYNYSMDVIFPELAIAIGVVAAVVMLYPAFFYIQHIFAPGRSTAFVGMTWQETRQALPQSALRKKLNQRARDKAYKKIAVYHEYMEKGVMTPQEYEDNRLRILNALK